MKNIEDYLAKIARGEDTTPEDLDINLDWGQHPTGYPLVGEYGGNSDFLVTMDNKEAIRRLKDHFRVHDDGRPTPYLDEAVFMAYEALEKQIPEPPYMWGDGYYDGELIYDMWDCPNCGKSYERILEEYDYCPNCGQKIKWKEEDLVKMIAPVYCKDCDHKQRSERNLWCNIFEKIMPEDGYCCFGEWEL